MLVLSRKLNEKLVIGDDIVITVCRIDRHQVRIGIEAPRELSVVRPEVSAPADAARREPTRQHS